MLLALFFLLSSARTIDGPIEHPREMLAVVAGFILYGALLLALTWRNWWLDHRLALPAHLIDLAFFFALDLASGMPITSPFFVFFIYLILAAAARWGWRAGMRTAVVATVLFVSEHVLEGVLEAEDAGGFLYGAMRAGHLAVVALMMSWFGMTHLSGTAARSCAFSEIKPGEDPVLRALTHIANCMGGRWSAMVWTEPEEPWVNIAYWEKHHGLRTEQVGPEAFTWQVARRAPLKPAESGSRDGPCRSRSAPGSRSACGHGPAVQGRC